MIKVVVKDSFFVNKNIEDNQHITPLVATKTLELTEPKLVIAIAKDLDRDLAKQTVAAIINGKEVDASYLVTQDCEIKFITTLDEESLEVIRHSTAHLLAHAVMELFDDVKVSIGPVIENGFYYDFDLPHRISEEDFPAIEKKMRQLVAQDISIKRLEMSRTDAQKYFAEQGQDFKVEILSSIPEHESISAYEQDKFVDLCRGPHLIRTSLMKAFKLTKIAGAYFKGDSKNKMLQRIYGTAWRSQQELDQYLFMVAEAEKRDHRKLGKQLNLFMFSEFGQGFAFWLPRGMVLRDQLEFFWKKLHHDHDYQEIKTPIMLSKELWQISGHWENYRENMYVSTIEDDSIDREYAIKPMNCPGCVLVYKHNMHSYKEFPIKYSELGLVHRHEASGALHGLFRVRQFTQDDAHVFMLQEQIEQEVVKVMELIDIIYKKLGFAEYMIFLATKPENAIGSDEIWEKAETALKNAITKTNKPYTLCPQDGAFYGPKLDFKIKDSLGRLWQLSTIQLDFNLPERFDIHYIGDDGNKHRPVMLHRAIYGSLERLIGILIEHGAGVLPLFCTPVQAMVLNISEHQADYAQSVCKHLKQHGIRAELDSSNEKISYKIRHHSTMKIPYLLIVGDNEIEQNQVTVREGQGGANLGNMSVHDFVKFIEEKL